MRRRGNRTSPVPTMLVALHRQRERLDARLVERRGRLAEAPPPPDPPHRKGTSNGPLTINTNGNPRKTQLSFRLTTHERITMKTLEIETTLASVSDLITRAGIVCSCGSAEFHVVRTTPSKGGILRRRECCVCGQRLTTKERPVCGVAVNMPTTSIGQLATSIAFSTDRPVGNSAEPQN